MSNTLRVLYWTPRILCILAILFVSLFAIDSFDPTLTIGQQLAGFIIHLIPSFILLVLLVVAWRWELAGGIMLAAIGIGFSPVIFVGNYNHNHSFWMSLGIIASITFPFIITGMLFIIHHVMSRKNNLRNHSIPAS